MLYCVILSKGKPFGEIDMIKEDLKRRVKLPIENIDYGELKTTREHFIQMLCEKEYGTLIPKPEELYFEESYCYYQDRIFVAGKAPKKRIIVHAKLFGEEFTFPFWAIIPNKEGKYPFIIHNDFEDTLPSKYTPIEEIIDNGFALFSLCYKDITSDDNDFDNGLARIVYNNRNWKENENTGKILMWAWANMRVMDYCITKSDKLDLNHSAIAGHSRLGKTALVTGMLDERFKFVIDNESGCSGSALTYGKKGEQISDITKNFPYWFCENYKKYVDHEKLDFDQHLLLATIAPRTVLIGSAIEDNWADPNSQYLTCIAASKMWENYGKNGFIHPNRYPKIGDNFDKGNICYHLRDNNHYFSRIDWNIYMDTIKKKQDF